jgi:fructokinase
MLLSCGDALIDFVPIKSIDGRDAFLPMVGGSCLNVAIGMARLGAPAGYISALSTDLFGGMIADHARASRVDLRYAQRNPRPTTLAFVHAADGEPQYAFYDQESAALNWTYVPGSFPFTEIDVIHVGSTTLVNDGAAAQTLRLIEDARGSTTISFDPNCRPNLVDDKARYLSSMEQFAKRADILRLSDGDFAFLYGGSDYAAKAAALLSEGTKLFVVTRGLRGARAWHTHAGVVEVDAPRVHVVDTIGAGDSFQAALLVALWAMRRVSAGALSRLTPIELSRALAFAASCAALACSRRGADPPWIWEIGPGPIGPLITERSAPISSQ